MTDEQVAVTLHTPPGEDGPQAAAGWIPDTAEARAQLEAAAIPACLPWRAIHPDPVDCSCGHQSPRHAPAGSIIEGCASCPCQETFPPAPYCCSAYCDRCAGLRALDGAPPLRPNEWMYRQ